MRSKQLQKIIDQGQVRGNVLDRVRRLEMDASERYFFPLKVDSLANISEDLGDMVSGRFIAPSTDATVSEPSSTGFTGAFISADGETFEGTKYHIGTVKNGVLGAGMNTDGDFLAATGAYVLDETGATIDGINFLENHTAEQTNTRRMRRGFSDFDNTTPVYIIEYIDDVPGANLITTNPAAESGNTSGWTETTWTFDVNSVNPINGVYDFQCVGIGGIVASDKYNVTASKKYTFAVTAGTKSGSGDGTLRCRATWYTSGDVLISQIAFATVATPGTPTRLYATLLAPATAAKAVLVIDVTGSSTTQTLYFDDAGIYEQSEYSALRFDDDGVWVMDETREFLLGSFVSAAQKLYTAPNAPLASGATVYATPYTNGYQTTTTLESQFAIIAPCAGTISSLRVVTTTAQNAGGSLVITARGALADTSVVATVTAGGSAGVYWDTTNSATVAKDDFISFKLVNNVAATSASVASIQLTFTPS